MHNFYPLDVIHNFFDEASKAIPSLKVVATPCETAVTLTTAKLMDKLVDLTIKVNNRNHSNLVVELNSYAPVKSRNIFPDMDEHDTDRFGSSYSCAAVMSNLTDSFALLKERISNDPLTGLNSPAYKCADHMHKACETFLTTHAAVIDKGPILLSDRARCNLTWAYASVYPRALAS